MISSIVRGLLIAVIAASPVVAQEWHSLFDGKSLKGWQETGFTNHGEVHVEDGVIVLGAGNPMTGITWTGSFSKADYEIRFEAVRQAGNDFFASITFPVGDSFATWVLGGWGGDIVGISSIDGWDASENETRSYFNFENGRWYSLRLQVSGGRIKTWIGDSQNADVDIRGRAISLRRGEIKLSAPLGFASYLTRGSVRKIEYRLLKP
jgi:hypothetical protein